MTDEVRELCEALADYLPGLRQERRTSGCSPEFVRLRSALEAVTS